MTNYEHFLSILVANATFIKYAKLLVTKNEW